MLAANQEPSLMATVLELKADFEKMNDAYERRFVELEKQLNECQTKSNNGGPARASKCKNRLITKHVVCLYRTAQGFITVYWKIV